jgi:serralysin
MLMPAGLLNGSTVPITGNNLIDAMTNGYRWQLDSSRTIDWSISDGWYSESWINSSAAIIYANEMFAVYSYYANINFEFLGYYSDPSNANYAGSDINIALDAYLLGRDLWGIGNFPIPNDPNRGDIYININSLANFISYEPGSAGWFFVVHEIGHVLGLKHPHDDGGTGRPTFHELGWIDLDIDYMTVMSYNDDYNYNLRLYDPATPMILDVLALQYLYGKNISSNAGDTNFTINNLNAYLTIWDASGSDLIDQSSAGEGWYISLPNTQLTELVDTKAGVGLPLSDINLAAPRSLAWLAGDIENVLGSRFADHIYGNDLSNNINGYVGDDLIDGGAGNDSLDGGPGTDLAMFSGLQSAYRFALESNTLIVSGPDGTDTLTNVEGLRFGDAAPVLVSELLATPQIEQVITVLTNGVTTRVLPDLYTGPVAWLEYQMLGNANGNVAIGTSRNDFFNLLGGDDAANGQAGDDVLDGGTGSNFLSGGAGRDDFFLDGRGGTTTWATITDWEAGERLSVWGWRPGVSQVQWVDRAGAVGWEGVTMHADLDRNGVIDTSVTWTGLTRGRLPSPLEFDGLLWFT